MQTAKTMQFMRERVIDVDEKDRQVWALITDVPKVKTPWQYVCFILNVIIPGKLIFQYFDVGTIPDSIKAAFISRYHPSKPPYIPLSQAI